MEQLHRLIKQNYETIKEQVEIALQDRTVNKEEVKIVVVTKRKPVETLMAAMECGIRDFGENYPEETVEKINLLEGKGANWHMIGHIQSRKANLVASNFQFAHSIDTLRIAEKLASHCQAVGRQLPVLLECNVSGEGSKYGFEAWNKNNWYQLVEVVGTMHQLRHLKIIGLMTMPPWNENPETNRPYFALLRKLLEHLNDQLPNLNLRELSMGTSIDYIAGVKEGATILRIGTAILGGREN